MFLNRYRKGDYTPGAGLIRRGLWFLIGSPLIRCSVNPSSYVRRLILRCFGTRIGSDVVIRPGVRIKFPWRLSIGDHVWIGEDCWIDNLADVSIGSHVCISQSVYLCTGNHDWASEHFDLRTAPIVVEDHCWIAARVSLAPGVHIAEGAVVTLGSVVQSNLDAWTVYSGVPAEDVGKRPKTNG